jgi:hypothetical protein
MAAWKKVLLGVGCFISVIVWIPFVVAAVAGWWHPETPGDEWSQAAWLVFYIAFPLTLLTWIAAIVHVARRRDLVETSKRHWIAGLVFASVILPWFWWRLIRPLPTG